MNQKVTQPAGAVKAPVATETPAATPPAEAVVPVAAETPAATPPAEAVVPVAVEAVVPVVAETPAAPADATKATKATKATPKPVGYVVTPGVTITSTSRGILSPGMTIAPGDLSGGDEAFARLVETGRVMPG